MIIIADEFLAIMIPLTVLTAILGAVFGGSTIFICDDPNNCTSAAIDDIADFDITDLLDIAQFLFIFLGDVLQLLAFGWLDLPNGWNLFFLLLLTVPWAIYFVGQFTPS